MRNARINALILCALFIPALAAQSFDALVKQITNSAADLQVEAKRLNADLMILCTENNLANPEVSLESLFGVFGDNKYNVGLSQAFDWPGLYSARRSRQQAVKMLNITQLEQKRAEVSAEVAGLIADIIVSTKKVKEYELISTGFNELLANYEREYANGNVSILDVNKLRIEAADHLSTLEEERSTLADLYCSLAAIAPTLDPAEIDKQIPDELPLLTLEPLETYLDSSVHNAPEIILAKAQFSTDLRGETVAQRSNYPGFSLGYRFSHEDGQVFNGFTFGMTIPAWGNRGKKAAAEKLTLASYSAAEAAIARVESRLKTEYKKAESIQRRIERYSQALMASDNVKLLRRAFDAGQITLTEYMQDLHYFINAHLNLLDLRCSFTKSIITLQIISGYEK